MVISFAPAEEIGEYFIGVAKKHELHPAIKFESLVAGARWDEPNGKWVTQVTDLITDKTEEHTADVLVNAGGILNDWKWPDIPGLDIFKGKKVHTAAWVSRLYSQINILGFIKLT